MKQPSRGLTKMNFDQAAVSHIAWKEKLLGYLDKPNGLDIPADLTADNKCDLGQWIDGEGTRYSLCPEYAILKRQHTRFHRAVGQVVSGARIGLTIRPETLLGQDTEFGQASAAVVAAIMKLKRTVQQPSAIDSSRECGIPVDKFNPPPNRARSLDWRPCYSVGVAELDRHHQYFFDLVNLLQQGISECREESVVQIILAELADYARYHFSREEELMKEAHYSGFVEHRREHGIFLSRLAALTQDSQASAGANAYSLLDFVRSWLVKHIQQVDKKYSADLTASS